MNYSQVEQQLAAHECYQAMQVPDGSWLIVRLEGRALSQGHRADQPDPFDERFRTIMIRTAHAVMEELGGVFAHVHNDEISILFPFEWARYDRRVEYINSLASSVASAAFTLACGQASHFISRVWVSPHEHQVLQYFRWRQVHSVLATLDMWVYRLLRQSGRTDSEAHAEMEGKNERWRINHLHNEGVRFRTLPLWQKRGVALFYETECGKVMRHTSTGEPRRRLREERNLPTGEDYINLLHNFIRKEATRMRIQLPVTPVAKAATAAHMG